MNPGGFAELPFPGISYFLGKREADSALWLGRVPIKPTVPMSLGTCWLSQSSVWEGSQGWATSWLSPCRTLHRTQSPSEDGKKKPQLLQDKAAACGTPSPASNSDCSCSCSCNQCCRGCHEPPRWHQPCCKVPFGERLLRTFFLAQLGADKG